MLLRLLEFLAGLTVAALTLRDLFDTVVVPGSSDATLHTARRLVFLLLPVWKRLRGPRRGLSTMFAPLVLVGAFAIWMLLLILGFALMLHSVGSDYAPPLPGFADAVFAAGTALVTVGTGNGTVHGLARWVILAAGFCGLASMTMAVTYLLEVQSSISRRDKGILKLRTSAGEPPSAVALLEKYAAIGARGELAHVLRDARDWCATVLQSHAAHPSLIYFRSTGTGSGWPAALGAMLDLALIAETWLAEPDLRGLGTLLRQDGAHMATEIGTLIDLEPDPGEGPSAQAIREMEARLTASGYRGRADFDAGAFARARERDAAWIRTLARHLGRPPTSLIPPESSRPENE